MKHGTPLTPFRIAAALVVVLCFAAYLGFWNWKDRRAARKAGKEWEGEVI